MSRDSRAPSIFWLYAVTKNSITTFQFHPCEGGFSYAAQDYISSTCTGYNVAVIYPYFLPSYPELYLLGPLYFLHPAPNWWVG